MRLRNQKGFLFVNHYDIIFFKKKYQQYYQSFESMTLIRITALNATRKFSRRDNHHKKYLKGINFFSKESMNINIQIIV